MQHKLSLLFLFTVLGLSLSLPHQALADACSDCLNANGGNVAMCSPICSHTSTGPGSETVDVRLLLDDTLKSLGFKFDSSVTLGKILTQLLLIIYGISGMGFLVYLIYGGFEYLTSAGDPKKAETAKTILTHAVIGFFLIVVAFWITQIVSFVFNLGTGFPG